MRVSPDCEVKKHAACSGDAWDNWLDHLAPCFCPCRGERAHECTEIADIFGGYDCTCGDSYSPLHLERLVAVYPDRAGEDK